MGSWIIVTGEYPPKVGGVAAYTRKVAVALAEAGDEVTVYAPAPGGALASDRGVQVHPLPDHLGWRSLLVLERAVAPARRRGARLLVQYVPQSFGMRAMNVPFCAWLATRAGPFEAMFHEVAFDPGRSTVWRHQVIGGANHVMAKAIASSAERVFISTSAWRPTLRRIAPRMVDPTWLPVPSNLSEAVDVAAVARARASLRLSPGALVIGAFGASFGGRVGELLEGTLRALFGRGRSITALLLGNRSDLFAARAFAGAGEQVVATGALPIEELAAHVAACDVALQPYPDGVSTRRGSTMASLALGVPVITNAGVNTEPCWSEDGSVALAPEPSVEALALAADSLLRDPARRAEVGRRGLEAYGRRFSMARLIAALRA